jgi:RNase P subunit RPR2
MSRPLLNLKPRSIIQILQCLNHVKSGNAFQQEKNGLEVACRYTVLGDDALFSDYRHGFCKKCCALFYEGRSVPHRMHICEGELYVL